jgi:hypothetical protein
MASLAATVRIALRLLDRLGVGGTWTGVAWALAGAAVSIAVWAAVLQAGGFSLQ